MACDERDRPSFIALQFGRRSKLKLCVWAFDLLHHNGRDLRKLPLEQRKARLQRYVAKAPLKQLRYTEHFEDGARLLASCEAMGLEGVVAKRRLAPYRSGKCPWWIKVKCESWRAQNRERHLLFEDA